MAGYMQGYNKVDIAVANASSSYTTPYYDMGTFSKAIFICETGSMNASGSITLSAYQAVSSTGSGAQVLGIYTTMGSTTALACNVVDAVAAVLTGASTFHDANTVVVNGVTFTASTIATTGTFATARTFVSSSNGGLTTQTIEHLCALINHGTYGCTGLLAIAAGATYLTVSANPPGTKNVTITLDTSRVQIWGTRYVGTVEILADQLSNASSMRYVAVMSSQAAGETVRGNCVVVRTGARYSPDATPLVSAYSQGV